jgi:Tfp pilus assembly pilus retraction ATPase PilT
MQTGRAQGMQAMDDSIMQLLQAGLVTQETAREYAEVKKRFK